MTKTTIKPAEKAKQPLLVHEIDERLAIAQGRRAELEDLCAMAALDLVSGQEDHLFDELTGKIAQLDREIAALTAARPVAVQNQKKAEALARDKVWKGKLESCHSHLRIRDKAIAELAGHMAEAAACFARALEAGRKARDAAPPIPSINWSHETFVDHADLNTAIQFELFRLGPWDRVGQPLWPGAINPNWGKTTDPAKVDPLVDRVATATKFVIAQLKGEVVQEHTEPSEFVHAGPIDPLKLGAVLVDRGTDLSGLPELEEDATRPPRRPAPSLLPKGSTPKGEQPWNDL